MRQLKENIYVIDNDSEVLSVLNGFKQEGIPIPDFNTGKDDQFLFLVTYDMGFNLYIFSYSSKVGDSGYSAVYVRNFLSENRTNLKLLEPFGFDIIMALVSIQKQVMDIAARIDYPFTISTVISENFIGMIAEAITECN